MKALSILIVSLLLSGCDFFGETGDKPWVGHSLHKGNNKQEFWFISAKTREWCMAKMESELGTQSESWNKAWYSKPIGCSFRSNNLLSSIYYYETTADKSLYRCIGRRLNPENKNIYRKYQWMLDGYPQAEYTYECIWGD